jgi:hypothetical protein
MDRNRYPRRCSDYKRADARVGSTCPINKNDNDNCLCVDQPIAYAMSYVKKQKMNSLYPLFEGWRNGTIFPELNLPYCAGGNRR